MMSRLRLLQVVKRLKRSLTRSTTLSVCAGITLSAATAVILASGDATAVSSARAPSPVLSEIRYARKGLTHEYSIVRERVTKTKSGLPTKPGYALIFKESGRSPLKKSLKANEAEFYSNAMNRILWANEYGSRKPSSTATCREYVRIQVIGDKTRICQENKKLTGQSYGLLNELRSQFAK